jgi:signal transduction histidine kinase
VQENERQRLAHDLHDELGALLTAAKLDAARIRSRLVSGPPEALERLQHLAGTLDAVMALQRRLTHGLWPASLGHLGLAATLEILAREFAQRASLTLHSDLQPVALPPGADLVVYRLVQEALTNLGKHAQARQVWLSLAARDGQAVVTVRDDGTGFDTGAGVHTGHGLAGMRFRAASAGGVLALTSAPGQGTQVRLTLPLASMPPAAGLS